MTEANSGDFLLTNQFGSEFISVIAQWVKSSMPLRESVNHACRSGESEKFFRRAKASSVIISDTMHPHIRLMLSTLFVPAYSVDRRCEMWSMTLWISPLWLRILVMEKKGERAALRIRCFSASAVEKGREGHVITVGRGFKLIV